MILDLGYYLLGLSGALFYALYSSIPIKSHKTPTNNKNHPKFMINCTFQSPKHLHKLQ